MAEFPALQLWTDAYLGDTTHLTTIEHGAYLLLLMTAWRTGDCSLPNDDRLLARYVRMTPLQWGRIKPVVMAFWHVSENRIFQRRLKDEWGAVKQKREAAALNGRLSALKRKGRHATERKQSDNEASTTTATATANIPLDKSNGDGAGIDPEKIMFDAGVKLLSEAGKANTARAIIGKWKRDHGTEAVIVALGRAQREGAVDPVSFVEGCFRAKRQAVGLPSINDVAPSL